MEENVKMGAGRRINKSWNHMNQEMLSNNLILNTLETVEYFNLNANKQAS